MFYWAKGGIYVISGNENTGALQSQSITETTILNFYLDITPAAKKNARVFYDEQLKKIFWFYNSDPTFDGDTFRFKYDAALVFDLVVKAFYTYSMDVSTGLPFFFFVVTRSLRIAHDRHLGAGADLARAHLDLHRRSALPAASGA